MSRDDAASIEVFQDLTLFLGDCSPNEVRDAMADQATAPWRHAPERELPNSQQSSPDFFAFEFDAQDGGPRIGLVFWKEPGQLRVTNVVPLEAGQLTIRQYNHAMQEFNTKIVTPVASRLGLQVVLTKDSETLTDWMSPETAGLLRRFSSLANRSTGSSHPSDRARWMAFLIASHQENSLVTERLKRWLIEVEKWHPEIAVELVIEYEFGLELLRNFDQHRG